MHLSISDHGFLNSDFPMGENNLHLTPMGEVYTLSFLSFQGHKVYHVNFFLTKLKDNSTVICQKGFTKFPFLITFQKECRRCSLQCSIPEGHSYSQAMPTCLHQKDYYGTVTNSTRICGSLCRFLDLAASIALWKSAGVSSTFEVGKQSNK